MGSSVIHFPYQHLNTGWVTGAWHQLLYWILQIIRFQWLILYNPIASFLHSDISLHINKYCQSPTTISQKWKDHDDSQFYHVHCFDKHWYWSFCINSNVGQHVRKDWGFICVSHLSQEVIIFFCNWHPISFLNCSMENCHANVVLAPKENHLQNTKLTDHHEWLLDLATETSGP